MADVPLPIPEEDLHWTYARSGGPGGQNVNKVASKATLAWHFAASPLLSERARARLEALYPRYVVGDGWLQITSQNFRDQERNRQGYWSPKGDWIVFQTSRGESTLAAIRPDGGGWQSLNAGPGHATPTWSPDGATITSFDNSRGGFLHDVRAGLDSPQSRLLPPVDEGVLFWPLTWSPDSALLAGRRNRAGQNEGVVIYSVATGSYRTSPGIEASDSDLSDLALAFIGSQRLATLGLRDLWLRDLGGQEPRRLYAAPPGHRLSSLSATLDGRWLTWLDIVDESDIWLATIDEPGGTKGADAGAKP